MSIIAPPVFKPFVFAAIQLRRVADKRANLIHAREKVLQAARNNPKPHLVSLPEVFNSQPDDFPKNAEFIGYTQGRTYNIQHCRSESVIMLSSIAKEAGVWLIGGSIPERDELTGDIYNTCTVYSPEGDLVALHRKVHLFDLPGVFKESDTISAGNTLNYFDTDFARIGMGICYDIRFPELAMIAARDGCHMIIYPAAFTVRTGEMHYKLLHQARAVDNQIFVSMVSLAYEATDEPPAYGHTMVVDPIGKVLVEADRPETILYVKIDPEVFYTTRASLPVTHHRRFDVYPDVALVKQFLSSFATFMRVK